ncbi:MAG: hypothetical protein AB8B55_13710 [Mariniblastus sp.]
MFKFSLRTILVLVLLSAVWIQWNQDWIANRFAPRADYTRKISTVEELEKVLSSDKWTLINLNYEWSIKSYCVSKRLNESATLTQSYPLNHFDLIELDATNFHGDVVPKFEEALKRLKLADKEFPRLSRMKTGGLAFWKIEDRLYWRDRMGNNYTAAAINKELRDKTREVLQREGKRQPWLELPRYIPWIMLLLSAWLVGSEFSARQNKQRQKPESTKDANAVEHTVD